MVHEPKGFFSQPLAYGQAHNQYQGYQSQGQYFSGYPQPALSNVQPSPSPALQDPNSSQHFLPSYEPTHPPMRPDHTLYAQTPPMHPDQSHHPRNMQTGMPPQLMKQP